MLEGTYQGFVYQPTGATASTGASPHLDPSSSPAPQPPSSAYSTSEQPGHRHSHRHQQHYYRDSYDSTASSNSTNSSSGFSGYYVAQPPAQHRQQSTAAPAGSTCEPKIPIFSGHKSNHSDGNYFMGAPPHPINSTIWSVYPNTGWSTAPNVGSQYSWNYSPPPRPLTLSSPKHAAGGGKISSGSKSASAGRGGFDDDATLSPIPKLCDLEYVSGFRSRNELTTTVWEDEGTLCYQVDAKGICVARRADNQMVNGTKLLNVVGMSRGKRDGILKNERGRVVIKVGAMHLKGVWIALHRAKYLANKFHVCDALYPLFEDNPRKFVHPPSPVITRTLLGRPSNNRQAFWSDINSSSNNSKRASLPSIIDQNQGASRGPHHHLHPHLHPLDTTASIPHANTISPPPTLSLPRPQPGYQAMGYYHHDQPHPRPEIPADYTRRHHLFQNTSDPPKANRPSWCPDQQQHRQPIKLSYAPAINAGPEPTTQPSPSGNDREKRSHGDS